MVRNEAFDQLNMNIISSLSYFVRRQHQTNFVVVNQDDLSPRQYKTISKEQSRSDVMLFERANSALNNQILSVAHKSDIPPSGNKQDYLSYSRYWWLKKSPEGEEWIRKDGKINPIALGNNGDRIRLEQFSTRVYDLALAYQFSKKQVYADTCIGLLRAWFIDDSLRMNPSLEYSQLIPEQSKPRRAGVIDGRFFSLFVLDAIAIVSRSKSWTKSDFKEIDSWFSSYLIWLLQSPIGREASLQKNNHLSWYCFQVASIAYFIGDSYMSEWAADLLTKKITEQILPSGEQPFELKRRDAFHYACFNLTAISHLVLVLNRLEIKQIEDKYSILFNRIVSAINFLSRFHDNQHWPYSKEKICFSQLTPSILRMKYVLGKKNLSTNTLKLVSTTPSSTLLYSQVETYASKY